MGWRRKVNDFDFYEVFRALLHYMWVPSQHVQGRKSLFLLAQDKSSALQVGCKCRSLPRTASRAPIRAGGTTSPPSQGQARFARRFRRPLTGRACGAFWQRGRSDGTARPVLAGNPMRSLAFSYPHIVQEGRF